MTSYKTLEIPLSFMLKDKELKTKNPVEKKR